VCLERVGLFRVFLHNFEDLCVCYETEWSMEYSSGRNWRSLVMVVVGMVVGNYTNWTAETAMKWD
jgi:hypothetical protein